MANFKTNNDVFLSDDTPIHVQVQKQLKTQIAGMKVGDRLPTVRKLSKDFSVALVTVHKAMVDLEKEGYVVTQQGRGTFVRKTTSKPTDRNTETTMIAVVVPDIEIPDFARIFKGIEDQAARQGYMVQMCNSFLDNHRERNILESLKQKNLAGLILCPFFSDPSDQGYIDYLESMHREGKRVVLLDYLPTAEIPMIMANKFRLGYIGTEHLIMLGHENILRVTTGANDESGRQCLRGHKKALEDYGIKYNPELVIEIPIQTCAEPTREAVARLLKENFQACTGIVTEQFSMTYGILRALAELGLKAPDDMALVGGDVFQNPSLSYVTHTLNPSFEIGQAAVKALFQESSERSEDIKKHVLLTPKLVIGRTCGARRK